MRFAAIDLGASFIKSALLDTGSAAISHVQRVPSPAFTQGLPAGHREIPADLIFKIAKEQIDRLLAIAPDCAGIVSCGQMHGLVLTDRQGAPLTPFISWMDERSQSCLEKVADLGPGITTGSTISILCWLATVRGIPAGASPQSLSDFVMSRLCGSEPRCEPTMASGFGIFDVRNGTWRRDAIEKLGLGHLAWPKITRYREAAGHYLFGASRIPIYPSLGDQQCALLGAALKPGELSVNVSTGSQVSTVSDRFEPGEYQIRAYFDGLFLNTITHLPAGRFLNELVARLNGNWSALKEAAGRSEPAGQEFRAALETMADNYQAAARKLNPGTPRKRLVFSGGLISKSALLQQFVKQRFGLEARTSPTQEDTLCGLLAVANLLQPMEPAGLRR